MPIFILLAALADSLAIGELRHKAQDKNDAQLLFARVEEDAAEQQLVEDEATTDERVTPEILAEIRDKRDEIKESMDGLQRLNPGGASLAKVRSSLDDYETALDEELRLIGEGNIGRADIVDEECVDPGFRELHEVLEVASEEYEAEADRIRAIAETGTYAVGLGPAVFTAFLFLVYVRSQARGRRALEASEERYEVAIRGASDGIWDWNVLSDRTYFSPKWKKCLVIGTTSSTTFSGSGGRGYILKTWRSWNLLCRAILEGTLRTTRSNTGYSTRMVGIVGS